MAQAECITTAIRELMSRGRPAKSTSSVRAAHTEFVAALAGNVPHPIYPTPFGRPGRRADHLGKVFAALHVYFTAIIGDTRAISPAARSTGAISITCLRTSRAKRWAQFANAAEEMREHENWRAS